MTKQSSCLHRQKLFLRSTLSMIALTVLFCTVSRAVAHSVLMGFITGIGTITPLTSGDESYYKDSNPDEPKDDAQHFCITKEHTSTPTKSSTD